MIGPASKRDDWKKCSVLFLCDTFRPGHYLWQSLFNFLGGICFITQIGDKIDKISAELIEDTLFWPIFGNTWFYRDESHWAAYFSFLYVLAFILWTISAISFKLLSFACCALFSFRGFSSFLIIRLLRMAISLTSSNDISEALPRPKSCRFLLMVILYSQRLATLLATTKYSP